MRLTTFVSIVLAAVLAGGSQPAARGAGAKRLTLTLQRRTAGADKRLRITAKRETVDSSKVAVVVCDMWNYHWCKTLLARSGAMIPRMNRALDAARALGIQVVFCPSETMKAYKDHPRRKAVLALAKHPMPKPAAFNPPKPIGGGCVCGPKRPCKVNYGWTAQHPDLKIGERDFITDSAQGLYSLCKGRGITHILYMGVHTNMCVLYRPFGMVNMTRLGFKCVLVRDLTDAATGNDPAKGISPDGGTAAVIAHIERHIAPTIDSYELLRPARMAAAPPLRVLMLSGCWEYDSAGSLGILKAYLSANDAVRCTVLQAASRDDFPGLEALEACDVMLLFTRRPNLKGEQLERFKRYCLSGRPIVGVRTASHAVQTWPQLDRQVLGGAYAGHHGQGSGKTQLRIPMSVRGHAIMAGVKMTSSSSWMYKNTGIAKDCRVLIAGQIVRHRAPVAWVRTHKGGRIFYTSLGHQKDFRDENFLRMLGNALFWTAKRDVKRPPAPRKVGR